MNEDTPPGTQLARVMATDESSSVKDFRLEFVILKETVSNVGSPEEQKALSKGPDIVYFQVIIS